jgi:[acyl-carrier-protein] S-malonyltransferase
MAKIAFVFPGQGAQAVGMGKDLAEKFPACRAMLDSASKTIGVDMAKLCFEGPEEALSQTQNTQPALLTVSAMALRAFSDRSTLKPDFVAGHSLGEFTALYAAGAYSFEDAVGIVRKRGLYMSESSGGGMAAVLGMNAAEIESACRESGGNVAPANYNGDAQTVIAGDKESIDKVIKILTDKGAKKVIKLNVSAAFHSPFMKPAAEKLAADLDSMKFGPLSANLVNNVDAKIVSAPDEARTGLKRQVTGAVRWTDVMRVMLENGVRTVIEFGPGRTLTGMFKRMDKTLTLINIEDASGIEKALEVLNQNS